MSNTPPGGHDEPNRRHTPRADDLHRLVSALNAGPVDLFASSGGAVNALAFVSLHPEQVRTLVAHEPPAAQVLSRPQRPDPGRLRRPTRT